MNTVNNALGQSQANAAVLLNDFLAQTDSSEILTQVFGDGFNVDRGASLLELVTTDLTGETNQNSGIAFEIRPTSEINNASGAYSASNNTIYLSEEFLIENADNPDAIANLIIEEIGHYLDATANLSDAPGDEGAIFAAAVTGESLTDTELSALKSEDDTATVTIDGESIAIEQQEGVIFVDADAAGDNNGASWANAYTDLQSALAAAGASNQIWVAEGTYFPTTDGDRDISFVINNGVDVYGGFVGNETSLDQRDWQINETILSGNIGESGQADNSYNVVDITNSPANTTIDGLTITGGQADVNSFERTDHGGGLIGRDNAGATLRNLNIQNNFAIDDGGGIYLERDTGVTIDSVIFTNNSSGGDGGAIYVGSDNSLNVSNSLFLNNQSAGGGAIHISSITTLNVVNSTFYNNQGGEADDIYDGSFAPSNRTISNNIFSDDDAIDRAKIYFDVRLSRIF